MKPRPTAHLVLAWAALLVLLGLTLGSAYIPMGAGNVAANYAVALAKSAIVMVFFMHVARSGGFVRILALAGIAWLLILGALGLTDYGTRGPANASQPQSAQHEPSERPSQRDR